MSLPTRQQRALDRIEKALAHDHPGLGPLFAIFTTLVDQEAMPVTERVTAPRQRVRGQRVRGQRRRLRRGRLRRGRISPTLATLLGLAMAAVALFTLSLTLPSPQSCPGSAVTVAARMQSVPAGGQAACSTQQSTRGIP